MKQYRQTTPTSPPYAVKIHTTAIKQGGIVRALCGRTVYSVDTSQAVAEISCAACLQKMQAIYHGEELHIAHKQVVLSERIREIRPEVG